MPASLPHAVYDSIVEFFAPDAASGRPDPGRPRGRRNLLRTACVGNPERTLQGELFAYLKGKHRHVVLEYRHHRLDAVVDGRGSVGRSVDIMVLDDAFVPACAIELKHYSRVQGDLSGLLLNLERDRALLTDLHLPRVQVGVYTDLCSLPEAPRKSFEQFRFITAYAFTRAGNRRPLAEGCDATALPGHADIACWLKRHFETGTMSFKGASERFDIPAGTVAGRVHYVLGLAA